METPDNRYNSIEHAYYFSLGDVSMGEDTVRDAFYDRMEEHEITIDMFGDDSRGSIGSEDLLTATLQLHDLRKSTETLDMLDDSPVESNFSGAQLNEAFDEDLETTEI